MICKQRDVVSVAIPYTDDPDESKIRPAVVISPSHYNQNSGHMIGPPDYKQYGSAPE